MMPPDIFGYIKSEEARYDTEEVSVGDNWRWSMKQHIQLIFHLKNGIFYSGENNWLRAFKNIMEPILNLSYWMEDIEVKDIVFYIENATGRVASFLFKKYHDEVFVKEHDIDTMLDEITESDVDYGGVLVQKTNDAKPEILALNTVAFCDQTDMIGGPIGFKYNFSPGKLRSMEKAGWGQEKNGATITIDELITLATTEKNVDGTLDSTTNQSTGKNIEVYIVRGYLPENYLLDNNDMEYHCNQVQIVAFYQGKEGKKVGVILYRKKEEEGAIMFHTSKKVHGRALGRGMGESLLHPQIWTNFLSIHKMNMLEAGSKVLPWTDDAGFTQRQKIQNMENLEMSTLDEGKKIGIIPTVNPGNIQLFENSINDWYQQAQLTGSAFDPVLGQQPASGTTFRGQERIVQQGRGLHDRRRGQRAKFIELVYRQLIIPKIKGEILGGKKFLATLTSEELTWVSERLASNYANKKANDLAETGQFPPDGVDFPTYKEQLKQEFLTDFSKKGNKHLLEILKSEFEDVEIKLGINVAGKQKDLAGLSDKLLSIFQFVFANPAGFQQAMKMPALAKSFEDILEYGGMSISDFNSLINTPIPQPSPMQPPQQGQPLMQPQGVL